VKINDFKEAIWITALWLITVAILVATGHCSISKPHSNSIGSVMYQDNPFTYKAGAVIAVAYVGHDEGLVVRIQPIGTYGLFTEDVLLCTDQVDMFLNKTNPMVLTYRTQASRTIEGVGCHELVDVSSLKPKESLE
jgi:hypothetical protein